VWLPRRWATVGYAAPLEVLFQFLRYERAISEDHPAHDGRLLRVKPVTQRRVCAAVNAPDQAEILVNGPRSATAVRSSGRVSYGCLAPAFAGQGG
jgi:hypothetical protein